MGDALQVATVVSAFGISCCIVTTTGTLLDSSGASQGSDFGSGSAGGDCSALSGWSQNWQERPTPNGKYFQLCRPVSVATTQLHHCR